MRRRGYILEEVGSRESSLTEGAKPDVTEKLLELKALRDSGAITEEEYEEKRRKYVDKL